MIRAHHPDYGDLDAYRTGDADAAVAEHVAACGECQQSVAEIAELAELVRRELMPVAAIPPRIRRAAAEAAERGRRRQMRLRLQCWAMAATVVLGIGALWVWRQMGSHTPATLDAVDALALARQITAPPADARFDMNGDGKVDGRDIDAALRRAVSVLVAPAMAEPPSAEEVQFNTVDLFVDAGSDALAAYQLEITTTGDAKIVGVEGGEHRAFHEPAYYDPAALRGGRIILAAFSIAADLPSGRTRVATLHMGEAGAVTYHARLMAAARADGSRFTPAVSVVRGGER